MKIEKTAVITATIIITLTGWCFFLITGRGHFFALSLTAVVCAAWYHGLATGILTGIVIPLIAGILMVVSQFETSIVAQDVVGFLFISILVGASIGSQSDMNQKLRRANRKVKRLEGMIPICANCKSVRSDDGFWEELESYVQDHSDAEFTHGVCPTCAKKLFPDFDKQGSCDHPDQKNSHD